MDALRSGGADRRAVVDVGHYTAKTSAIQLPKFGTLHVPNFGTITLEGGQTHCRAIGCKLRVNRSEEHTSELQSLMRISYAVFCLKKKKIKKKYKHNSYQHP